MKLFKLLFLFLVFSANLVAEQKVVLISGATSGIGLAAAQEFHAKGWKVWAGYRSQPPEQLQPLIGMRFCRLDVTNDEQIQQAIKDILQQDGRIDVLINNAGYGLVGAEETVTIDEAQYLFDVNFFGVLRLTQAVLPTMRAQKSGNIINISSGVGVHALPGLGLYSASKHAVEALSETLAATLAHWNIKVSVVEPGFVKNDWGSHCVIGSRFIQEEFYKKLNKGICKMLSVPRGQPTQEVAKLLVEIAEASNPHVRYQTNPEMTHWISETLVDPTGMNGYRQNLQFIQGNTR